MSDTGGPMYLAAEAGGAALDEVIGLGAAGIVVTIVILVVAWQHRTRRITWLKNLGDRIGARFDRPGWVALPIAIFVATLITALFGFIWDVSLHIGNGRDEGPLANPAHYFILIGLFMLFVAGVVACVLPYEKPGPSAVRITKTWYAPVSGLLMAGCGLYALIGFPLDDGWHRIFGQDVTLWGPTHLMLIGGAGFSTLTALLLEYEGRRAKDPGAPEDRWGVKLLQYLAFGGVIVGLSVYQIEFDFGVPQFRLPFQPLLIAAAGALALVAARIMLGRGAAIIAMLMATALRGGVALVVGGLGAEWSWWGLYLGSAVLVELLALTPLIKKPILFGAVSGLAIGTVGLWLESFWIDAVYFYPWPTSMWPEALAMAVPTAILTGICGAMFGMVLTGRRLPRRPVAIGLVVATVGVIAAATANGLTYTVPRDATASITITDAAPIGDQRMVTADVRINPPDTIGADPEWVAILSWQGKITNQRGLEVDMLQRVGDGHYVSTRPFPASGTWKSLLRVQDGKSFGAVPIFLAGDPAVNIPEFPLEMSSTQQFQPEITILQRERTFDAPGWLWTAACLVVLFCTLAMIASLTWGAGRINDGDATEAEIEHRPTVQA